MISILRSGFKSLRDRHPLLDGVWETVRGRKHPIFLEFPIAPRARYGYATATHEKLKALIGEGEVRYREHLEGFVELRDSLASLPGQTDVDTEPAWENGSFPVLDALALYGFLTKLDPETYLEVGYGNSTKFARRAIRDHDLQTTIVAIDPYTKPGCDELCDRIIHQTMEDLDLETFTRLKAGDVLFIDGSHWVFQNSDVVVFFLDVLPQLQPGVWVHLHDIPLPNDYGPDFVDRYWSEQYMLAAWLLGGGAGIQIELPNHYLWKDSALVETLAPLRDAGGLAGQPFVGSSFWFRTV